MGSPTNRQYILIGLLALVVILICALLYRSHGFSSQSSMSVGAIEGSGTGVMLGAHIQEGAPLSDFTDLETSIGRKLAIDSAYEDWKLPDETSGSTSGFPDLSRIAWDKQNGRAIMISWRTDFGGSDPKKGCATAADIIAGKYDAQIKQQADMIKSADYPVMIRWNYEMTDNDDNVCFNNGVQVTPKDMQSAGPNYVASWKHIVDIFRAEGATNVQWVWAPGAGLFLNSDNTPDTTDWKYFYPGDDYVDWIADDNYNKSDKPEAFTDDPAIKSFYDQMSVKGKPLMQSETGANHDSTQNPDPQTVWIQTAYQALKTEYPDFEAFIYWDTPGSAYLGAHKDSDTGYQLQGPGLAAFKVMANDPYFEVMPSGT